MGHCGLHSPGIGWVVKGLEQPVAWLCSRVDGWIPFFEHNRARNKSGNSRNKCGNLRNKRGKSRNGVQCGFRFWSAQLRAICWHWPVAFIPQELYINQYVDVEIVSFDQCVFGLLSPSGIPVRKRTFFLTNHPVVKSTFRNRYCQQNHEHRQCQGYENGHRVSKFCERYPPMLVAILTSKCASRHNAMHFFDISTYKSAPRPPVLTLLTSKCASRHNGVHFFDISTSKSAPRPSVFNTFYFQMCFAPQRRALFQHLNFQNCSEPKFLTHFTSKCASRHNAVHFFNISTSKSGPILRCFVPFHFEIGFAPQRRATFHLSSPQMSLQPPL